MLPFDAHVARAAPELRKKLENAGKGIGPIDTLVAATALAQKDARRAQRPRAFPRSGTPG